MIAELLLDTYLDEWISDGMQITTVPDLTTPDSSKRERTENTVLPLKKWIKVTLPNLQAITCEYQLRMSEAIRFKAKGKHKEQKIDEKPVAVLYGTILYNGVPFACDKCKPKRLMTVDDIVGEVVPVKARSSLFCFYAP